MRLTSGYAAPSLLFLFLVRFQCENYQNPVHLLTPTRFEVLWCPFGAGFCLFYNPQNIWLQLPYQTEIEEKIMYLMLTYSVGQIKNLRLGIVKSVCGISEFCGLALGTFV